MDNNRQSGFIPQLLIGEFNPLGMQTNGFSPIADTHHRDTFPSDVTQFTKLGYVVSFSIVPRHHFKAGWAAVHGIMLSIKSKIQVLNFYELFELNDF